MLLLRNETVVVSLNIIFSNILQTGIYPDIRKLANVTPIRKVINSQLKTIGQYLFFPFLTVYIIQYQAGLTITGAWQGSNGNKLYEPLGWESLSDRHFIRRALHLFKIGTNLTAVYLNDKLLPLRTPTRRNNNPQIYRDKNPNNHVEFQTESILNTFSNFCLTKTVIRPCMTNEIKQKLKEKAKVYKKYVKNNFDPGYKQLLDEKIQQSSKLIRERQFREQGKKLLDPSLGPNKYWSTLNNFFLQKKQKYRFP